MRQDVFVIMTEHSKAEKWRNLSLLGLAIILLSVIMILSLAVVSGPYESIAENYGIHLPFWLVWVPTAIAVVIMYLIIGVPIAKWWFHDLTFRRSVEKQLIWGVLFLPFLTILAEIAVLYIIKAVRVSSFFVDVIGLGTVFLGYITVFGVVLGVFCAIGIRIVVVAVANWDRG